MKKTNSYGKLWFTRFAVLVFWLVLWYVASRAVGYDILLPSPIAVMKRFFELIFTAQMWSAVALTGGKILAGFILAVLCGFGLAVLSSVSRPIKELLLPFFSVMKSVPVASFVILALICFNSDYLSVFIAFVMVLPIIYINVLSGISSCDVKMKEMARVFRLNPINKALYVYFPYVFPFFRSGLAISLGLCWKAGVAAELIGIPQGSLGEQLYFSKVYFQMTDLLSWTLVIVLVSAGFEKMFLFFVDKAYALYERK